MEMQWREQRKKRARKYSQSETHHGAMSIVFWSSGILQTPSIHSFSFPISADYTGIPML